MKVDGAFNKVAYRQLIVFKETFASNLSIISMAGPAAF